MPDRKDYRQAEEKIKELAKRLDCTAGEAWDALVWGHMYAEL